MQAAPSRRTENSRQNQQYIHPANFTLLVSGCRIGFLDLSDVRP